MINFEKDAFYKLKILEFKSKRQTKRKRRLKLSEVFLNVKDFRSLGLRSFGGRH